MPQRSNNGIRMGYQYNPYNDGGKRRFRRTTDFNANNCIIIDVLMTQDHTNHGDMYGWQLLFPDAHAELKINYFVYDTIGTDPNGVGKIWGKEDDDTYFNSMRWHLENDS